MEDPAGTKGTTSGINKLAETLLFISYDEFNKHRDEVFIYTDDLYDSIAGVEQGEMIPACPYFIEVCNQFAGEKGPD